MEMSRVFLENYNNCSSNEKGSEKQLESIHFPRLFQQGKQISQIISYIWRWSEPEEDEATAGAIAKELGTYFKDPSKLHELFSAIPQKNGEGPAKYLYEVFCPENEVDPPDDTRKNWPAKDYFFPIFDKTEREHYEFTVDTNKFQGTIEDANLNHPKKMILLTPYPPRPQLGPATITKKELDQWIKDTQKDKVISDNLYIPTCTS